MKHIIRQTLFIASLALSASLATIAPASAQSYLPKLGGRGGGPFDHPCTDAGTLTGFQLRTGDDVDAIRPLCIFAFGPADISAPPANVELGDPSWHGGAGGGQVQRLLCPASDPVVLGLGIYAEGQDTVVVNSIGLFCGKATTAEQSIGVNPTALFEAPYYTYKPHLANPFLPHDNDPHSFSAFERCPAGQVAVGFHGRSGIWVDAIGLICNTPRIERRSPFDTGVGLSGSEPRTVVGSIGRVHVPDPNAHIPICDSARAARARNSPAAPNLEAQCRQAGGDPSKPAPPPVAPALDLQTLANYADRGRSLAQGDPLLKMLYDSEPDGPNRSAFEIGLGVGEGQTAQGPGKEKIKQDLGPQFSKEAYQRAIDYTIDRNANQAVVVRGSLVIVANPAVAAARATLPLSNAWLGFTIAAGLFGNPADGAIGNTARGAGSNHIHDRLSASAQTGYDAALAFFHIP